jgi:hypothetical protein
VSGEVAGGASERCREGCWVAGMAGGMPGVVIDVSRGVKEGRQEGCPRPECCFADCCRRKLSTKVPRARLAKLDSKKNFDRRDLTAVICVRRRIVVSGRILEDDLLLELLFPVAFWKMIYWSKYCFRSNSVCRDKFRLHELFVFGRSVIRRIGSPDRIVKIVRLSSPNGSPFFKHLLTVFFFKHVTV